MKRKGWGPQSALLIAAGAVMLRVGPVRAQQTDDTAMRADSAQSITLDEAVMRALQRSPTMAQAEQQVENASASRLTSLGAFLPSLSLSTGASVRSSDRFDPTTDRVVSGSANTYSGGLSGGYDLGTGARLFSDLDQSRWNVRAAEARRESQRFSVTLQTKQMFFTALKQDELLQVAQSRLNQALESLDMTRRQSKVGMATASDTLRARLEFVNARQAVLTAETGSRNARFALGHQVGSAKPVAPVAPDQLGPAPLSLPDSAIMRLAEETSPSVRAAQAATEASVASLSSARTTYWPSLRLSSGYNWANSAATLDGGSTSWSLSFSGGYPIFNNFTREASIDRAEASRNVAQYQEDDARLAARQEADAALRSIETATAAIDIAQEAVRVAEEDLRVVRERYRVGVATALDVVTSQVALDQANVNLVNARYDWVTSKAQLEAVVGKEL